MSDVWQGGNEGPGGSQVDFGRPNYEEGIPLSMAFSVDQVFRIGFAALKEQPMLVLLAGLNMMIMQYLPQVLSQFSGIFITVSGLLAELDPNLVEGLSIVISSLLSLAFLPLQLLVLAGASVAVGNWIRNEEVGLSLLYTSFQPAFRAFLYAILQGLITMFAAVVLLTPAVAAAALLHSAGLSMVGMVVGGILMFLGAVGMIYIALGLMLGPYVIALDGVGPAEALGISWQAASGARLTLFVLQIVFGLLIVMATCCFFLPAIPVLGIQAGGFTGAWLLHSRAAKDTKEWSFYERNGLGPRF